MSPDRRPPPKARSKRRAPVKIKPGKNDPYDIVYFKRHVSDDPGEIVPGQRFLNDTCPANVRATMKAVLVAVAAAPPPRFAGGGYWEAMKGDMTGYYEVRVDGPKRRHYRLFCLLDTAAEGRGPLLTVLCGADKAFRTTLSDADYAAVRALGAEYKSRNPRSVA